MSGNTCEGCRFMCVVDEGGECRRHAPRASVLPVFTPDMETVTVWPTVESDDPACGEYEAGE